MDKQETSLLATFKTTAAIPFTAGLVSVGLPADFLAHLATDIGNKDVVELLRQHGGHD